MPRSPDLLPTKWSLERTVVRAREVLAALPVGGPFIPLRVGDRSKLTVPGSDRDVLRDPDTAAAVADALNLFPMLVERAAELAYLLPTSPPPAP